VLSVLRGRCLAGKQNGTDSGEEISKFGARFAIYPEGWAQFRFRGSQRRPGASRPLSVGFFIGRQGCGMSALLSGDRYRASRHVRGGNVSHRWRISIMIGAAVALTAGS
jgi:hypothetical protein